MGFTSGLFKLTLPCARIIEDRRRRRIGIRTEADQRVGSLEQYMLVIHPGEYASTARLVGRIAPQAAVSGRLNLAGKPTPDPLPASRRRRRPKRLHHRLAEVGPGGNGNYALRSRRVQGEVQLPDRRLQPGTLGGGSGDGGLPLSGRLSLGRQLLGVSG